MFNLLENKQKGCDLFEPLKSILPLQVVINAQNGKLTSIPSNKILLKTGEIIYFIDIAIRGINNEVRVSNGNYGGVSFNIFKGLTLHSGKRNNISKKQDNYEYYKGYIFITNKRLIFKSNEKPLEIKLDNITSIEDNNSLLYIQCGSKIHLIRTPESNACQIILRKVVNK